MREIVAQGFGCKWSARYLKVIIPPIHFHYD
jgi:hypothetical protein